MIVELENKPNEREREKIIERIEYFREDSRRAYEQYSFSNISKYEFDKTLGKNSKIIVNELLALEGFQNVDAIDNFHNIKFIL